MSNWVMILGMALVSYALRAAMLVTGGVRFPAWLTRTLGYVPIALFAALAAPGFLRPHGTLAVGPEAAAGVVAAIIAWRTAGKMPLVLLAGVGTFLVVRLLLDRWAETRRQKAETSRQDKRLIGDGLIFASRLTICHRLLVSAYSSPQQTGVVHVPSPR